MGNHRAILFPAEEGRPAHRFGLLKIPVTALRLSVIISSAKHIFDLAVIADPATSPSMALANCIGAILFVISTERRIDRLGICR